LNDIFDTMKSCSERPLIQNEEDNQNDNNQNEEDNQNENDQDTD